MAPILLRESDCLTINLSECRGSEFSDALAKVKEVPGRRFNGERKLWEFPLEPDLADRIIRSMRPDIGDPSIEEWVKTARVSAAQELTTPLAGDADLLIPWAVKRCEWQPETVNDNTFKGLHPYQRSAVDLIARKQKLILADDMGLGKTLQAISAIYEYALRNGLDATAQPKLIVCPNSVKGVWVREVRRWLGDTEPVEIIDGAGPAKRKEQLTRVIAQNGWAVVNWEQLRTQKVTRKMKNGGTKTETVMKQPLFASTEWLAVVADEAHRAKNRKASQTQGLWRVQAPVMIAATGTPIMNTPDELWSILKWLFPKEYTGYWRFYEEYVDYYETHFGKVITGVRNPDALRFELKDKVIRRTKNEVLDLPGKVRITVPVELSPKQRALYTKAEKELWLEIEKAAQEGDSADARLAAAASEGAAPSTLYRIPNGAARMVRLRQLLSSPALLGGEDDSSKLDAVQDRIVDNPHEPHLVYTEFVGTCNIMAERLRSSGLEVATYTGETSTHERVEIENSFQRGEIDVLIGTIKAMNTGITLTRGSVQHWIERHWNPKENEQGEDRQDRIGQTERVMIFIYEVQNSVDDNKVRPNNRLKEAIFATVLAADDIPTQSLTS